ncbi:MAG: hypothetical protein SVY41_02520 [Candidatus Nanohaloarchaea archaeon]|nr:hypothetical protein [Candidatus Nanohaloarchaea archaeon]
MGEELDDEKVVLETRALHPFSGGWCDWYGTGGEAVVTFLTMQHGLWNAWMNQCVAYVHDHEEHDSVHERLDCGRSERVVTPEEFDPSEMEEPGVYRDATHYDDEEKVDESYTIVLPYDFMSEKLCKAYIDELNETYDRNFVLLVEPAFKQLWRENQIARYEPGEDTLHLYTDSTDDVESVETEYTRYEILLRRDADTGDLIGFSIPRFSDILDLVEGEVRHP